MDYNDPNLESSNIQVPSRSPRRPTADLMEFGFKLSMSSYNHEFPDADDDVSSAEYKLCGPASPRESIFSTSSSNLEPDEFDLEELMDEALEDFANAEICTITDVVAYKHHDHTQVHLVET